MEFKNSSLNLHEKYHFIYILPPVAWQPICVYLCTQMYILISRHREEKAMLPLIYTKI